MSDTPIQKQYAAFKAKYPEYVLFFKVGDFYELFHDDARLASKVLGITLTTRSSVAGVVAMAGVPAHAVEGYLRKMIVAGHRVAICEPTSPTPELRKPPITAERIKVDSVTELTADGKLYVEGRLVDPAKPDPKLYLQTKMSAFGGGTLYVFRTEYGKTLKAVVNSKGVEWFPVGVGDSTATIGRPKLKRSEPSEILFAPDPFKEHEQSPVIRS